MAKTREQMEMEQRKRDAIQRKREKEAAKRERERIRAELEKDKLERKANKGKLSSRLGVDGYNPGLFVLLFHHFSLSLFKNAHWCSFAV